MVVLRPPRIETKLHTSALRRSAIDMMDVSPNSAVARMVSDLAVAQLVLCFLGSLARADSFVVAPLVALYAVRERDRRALMLYLLLVCVGALVDFFFLVFVPHQWPATICTLLQIALKVAVCIPGVKLHDVLPANRVQTMLKADVSAVVRSVLADALSAVSAPPAKRAPAAAPAVAPAAAPAATASRGAPSAAAPGSDSSWEQV